MRFFILVAVLAVAVSAAAQSTGMVKGKVVDAKGQPVEGAKITIVFADGVNRRLETKSNKRGEFMQIGLMPGNYKVTAEKENLTQTFDTRIRLGQTSEVNFMLGAAPAGGGMSKEMAAAKTAFDAGVTAARANDADTAVAKFTEAAALIPNCFDCHYNIAQAYMQKKSYAEAEGAFKKALEIKPDSAEAYNGLATLYNTQKKFDEAAAASAKAVELSSAAGGGAPGTGNADALYNQGVILWNAGKAADAQKQFEAAIAANPNHADAHYQLGLALVAQGNVPEAVAEFEAYVRIAPEGANAAQAKSFIAQLKK